MSFKWQVMRLIGCVIIVLCIGILGLIFISLGVKDMGYNPMIVLDFTGGGLAIWLSVSMMRAMRKVFGEHNDIVPPKG